MNCIIRVIFIFLILQAVFSCKIKATIENHNVDIGDNGYFDSVVYMAYSDMLIETRLVYDYMKNVTEEGIRTCYEKDRKGLYDAIYVNLKSDTLYILDCIAVEGYMSKVICWTNSDICVKKFPNPDWYKGRTPVINNKIDALRFRLISSWDIESIHRLDSITDRLIQRGVWETRDGCFYIATRIIFKGDAASYEFVRFNRWPIDLVDKEYYDERPK